MDTLDLRLECLKLAQAAAREYPNAASVVAGKLTPDNTTSVVERARAYADFVLARHDAPILRAAGELAKAVNSNAD